MQMALAMDKYTDATAGVHVCLCCVVFTTGTGDSQNQDKQQRPHRTCTFHKKHNTIPHRLTSIVHSVNGMERLVLTGKSPEGNLTGLHMWVLTPTQTARVLFSTKYDL